MNIKNILFYFSFMVITTIIYKYYTNLFINEINIQTVINDNIKTLQVFTNFPQKHIIILFLSFLTSKIADNIININI